MALRNIVDRETAYPHYFVGTAGDDRMIGNGTADVLFGGGGDDDINPGINTSGKPIIIYGGWSFTGFGHPASGTVGAAPGSPRTDAAYRFFDDGDDTLHIGRDIGGKGGSGKNTYIVHGPVEEGHEASASHFNAADDVFVFTHDEGFSLERYTLKGNFVNAAGEKVVTVKQVWLHGETDLTVHGQPADQHVRIGFNDDGRGAHTDFSVRWAGASPGDEIARALQDAAVEGNPDGGRDWDFLFA